MEFTKIKYFFIPKTVLLIGIYSKNSTTGISNNFQQLIDGLKERKISFSYVRIQTRSNGATGSFQLSHSLKVLASILSSWVKIFFTRNLYLQIALSKWGFFRDFLIIWPAAILGKTIFIRVHSGGYGIFYERQSKILKSIIRLTLERVHRIIVLGDTLRNQFNFSDKLEKKTIVIPNGCDIPGRDKNISYKSYKKNMVFRILFLSNLIESKGYLDLLKACQLLHQEGVENFFCDFCGDFLAIDEEKDFQLPSERITIFKQLIMEWQLDEHVAYHGMVTGSKKVELLIKSHVFVLPTNYLWEGQPLSIIEALSFGTPVISTAFRAIPDQIKDGYNGILVDYGHPDQIRNAINQIKNNEFYFQQLSKNALIQYKEKFTQKKHLDLLIPLITQ